MPKFFLRWDAGFGENWTVQDHSDEEAASFAAYENAREEFENSADWSAAILTPEIAEEYGLDDEAQDGG